MNGDSDADGDGDTDGADLLMWQRNLGQTASIAAVPEPMAGFLALAITPFVYDGRRAAGRHC